jgi:predicted dehydrogenase
MGTNQLPRIAVIGAGWYATLANIPGLIGYSGADLVAICDIDRNRATETAEKFGIPHRFTDVAELLSSGVADGVVVTVSHSAHYPVCRAALDAGLHVMVEKPMTLTARDAWDLVDRAAGLHLMVGQTFNFTTVAAAVRAALPRIGDLVQIVGTFSSHTQRLFAGESAQPDGRGGSYSDRRLVGGGQGHTQLSHLVGAMCWTANVRAVEVFAYFENRGLAVDLVNSISVRFSNGALGSLSGTGTMPPGQPAREHIVYYGVDGVIHYDLAAAVAEVLLRGGATERIELAPGEPGYPIEAPVRAFADLIAGRVSETAGAPRPAAHSVELLDAAYLSAVQGRPVSVS